MKNAKFHLTKKESGQECFYGSMNSLCWKKTGQKSNPSNVHIGIFYEVLDCLISEIDRRFSEDSCAVFCCILALCPEGQIFLFEEPLNTFANAYSVNQSDSKHEMPLVKKLLTKEPEQPTSIMQFLSF